MESSTGLKRVHFILLMGALTSLIPFTIDMYLPAFPILADVYETNATSVQLSLTACLLGLALGQLITGALSDVQGRRKPLLISLVAYIVASIACIFAPNIYIFVLLRFVQGFAASGGLVISRAIVRDVSNGAELTRLFALLMVVNNLVPLLAPSVGSGVLLFADWRGIFLVLTVLGIILLLVSAFRLKESLPPEKRVPSNLKATFSNFAGILKNRQFTGYALAQGFLIGGVFAYVSGTPFIYQNVYGVSPQTFSLLFGMNGIGLIIGSYAVGRFSYVWSEKRFLETALYTATTAGAVLLAVVLLDGPLWAVVIPIFFFITSIGVVGTAAFTLAMESQGHVAGSASALLGLLPFILGAATAPLVGIAGEDTAVPMGLVIFIMCSIALLAYIFLAKNTTPSTAK
ncbi:DHA1 family bicyclomycin/chloramphenicol resistance-like MFS transporter [Planomicrobium stackebrandtii]|uniref:Bcr/CflA family efflux transporter n=1 Tax=Planomicrobium stackebrandtii TaxID=253160 RepID=A0ABU0GV56_9BACL|nr:multidrug effflux MFS transporter [Planomicrobium stackebrandtii]MDQ0429241.1 DHA1 family bicyclomycin/chloramphenicol resistance-like MFS transporter [Planomicrobium stackebrandtii]